MGEWKKVRLSDFFKETVAGEWGDEPTLKNSIPVIGAKNFRNDGRVRYDNISFRAINPQKLARIKANQGDILIEKSGGSPAQPAGRVIRLEKPFAGTSTNFVQVCRVADDFDPEFVFNILFLMYKSGAVMKYQQQTTGIINFKLNQYLSEEFIHIPTEPTEQQKIAQILTKADEAIQQTERLIAKYEAIRTGLMQDLLTRGIDEAGNVRSEETHAFKDSALGRIPVEWEIERLGKICERIQDGTHFSPQPTRLGEFLYLTSKNIRMGRLNLKNVLYITKKEHDAIYKRCSVEEGDVLLTKDGANTGNVALNTLKVPFSLLSSVAFLRGKEDVLNNRYLNFCLVSPDMQSRLKGQMSGNAIPRITLTKINSTSIRLPLHPEQEIIETRFAAFEKEYKLELANLSKLNHLKTALMQDLLTGNKRVDDLLD